MLWCNVWVCKLNVNWVVDDEIASLNHVHMYALCFAQKLIVVVVVERCCCWWIIDEFMIGCCCWMMVRSWLYDVVVVVLWCSHQFMLWVLMKVLLWLNCGDFAIFGENGLIMKKFDFDDVEWVKEDC